MTNNFQQDSELRIRCDISMSICIAEEFKFKTIYKQSTINNIDIVSIAIFFSHVATGIFYGEKN